MSQNRPNESLSLHASHPPADDPLLTALKSLAAITRHSNVEEQKDETLTGLIKLVAAGYVTPAGFLFYLSKTRITIELLPMCLFVCQYNGEPFMLGVAKTEDTALITDLIALFRHYANEDGKYVLEILTRGKTSQGNTFGHTIARRQDKAINAQFLDLLTSLAQTNPKEVLRFLAVQNKQGETLGHIIAFLQKQAINKQFLNLLTHLSKTQHLEVLRHLAVKHTKSDPITIFETLVYDQDESINEQLFNLLIDSAKIYPQTVLALLATAATLVVRKQTEKIIGQSLKLLADLAKYDPMEVFDCLVTLGEPLADEKSVAINQQYLKLLASLAKIDLNKMLTVLANIHVFNVLVLSGASARDWKRKIEIAEQHLIQLLNLADAHSEAVSEFLKKQKDEFGPLTIACLIATLPCKVNYLYSTLLDKLGNEDLKQDYLASCKKMATPNRIMKFIASSSLQPPKVRSLVKKMALQALKPGATLNAIFKLPSQAEVDYQNRNFIRQLLSPPPPTYLDQLVAYTQKVSLFSDHSSAHVLQEITSVLPITPSTNSKPAQLLGNENQPVLSSHSGSLYEEKIDIREVSDSESDEAPDAESSDAIRLQRTRRK